MPYKFIEFRSGIVVFPIRVSHDKLQLAVGEQETEVPTAAGTVLYSVHPEGGIGDFDFSGDSSSLRLNAGTLSTDWEVRYDELECSPCKLTFYGPLFKTVMYLVPLAPGEITVTLEEEGQSVVPRKVEEVDMLELIAQLK